MRGQLLCPALPIWTCYLSAIADAAGWAAFDPGALTAYPLHTCEPAPRAFSMNLQQCHA
jgi:hypothetical protein